MKLLTSTLCKFSLFLLLLTGPAGLVEANKESTKEAAKEIMHRISDRSFHSADAINKMLHYKIAASPLYINNSAEIESARLKEAARRAERRMILSQAMMIYSDMELEDSGLSQKAFEYAVIGYYKLRKRGLLRRTGILSICDFSQSSANKRLYVIDMRQRKLLYRTYVAHGINSGEAYANSFSNRPESCKSSLGFYVTRKTYFGSNGLSLRIDGVEKGFNDQANRRNIVIHGASYVSQRILHKYGVMGTTFGCPAVPEEMSSVIIPTVKDGTCFFIYYPSKKYLARSAVLNG